MERTKSLSDHPRDDKRDSSSSSSSLLLSTSTSTNPAAAAAAPSSGSRQPSRELQRTTSLGLDLICKQFTWLRPASSNVVSCSTQVQTTTTLPTQNLPSPSSAGQSSPSAQQQHTSSPHPHPHPTTMPFPQSSFYRQTTSESSLEGHNSSRRIAQPSTTKLFTNHDHDIYINNLMHELRKTSGSLEGKLRILDDLTSLIRTQPLNEQTYSFILRETSELLDKSQPNEVRHKTWRFYTHLVTGRAENLRQLRYYLFDLIRLNDGRPEDIPYRIDFLIALTESGKTLLYYEEKMPDFLNQFYAKLIDRRSNVDMKIKKLPLDVQQKFLNFTIDLVKYNASIISPVLNLMIQYACQLAFDSRSVSELNLIYNFLNVVLSYAHLPSDSLNQFVIVLCIGVNNTELYETCMRVMRNLIGTYLGFACLTTLHHIIEDETNFNDKSLIRGAVYFLVESLWGKLSNEKVSLSPNLVLPALRNLIQNEAIASPHITLQVVNGIHSFLKIVLSLPNDHDSSNERRSSQQNVITKGDPFQDQTGKIVFEFTWDLVLDICRTLVYNIITKEQANTDSEKHLISVVQLLIEHLKNLLEKVLSSDEATFSNEVAFQLNESISIALLKENEKFVLKLFSILELGINYLSDESILKMIAQRLKYIESNYHNWIPEMRHLIEVFYMSNLNTSIRIQFLLELKKFLDSNYHFVDIDIFWEKVAGPFFSQNTELNCRELAVDFLIFIAKKSNSPKHATEIVEIFDNMAILHMRAFAQRQHSVEFNNHQQVRGHVQIMHQNSAPNQSDQMNDLIQSINGLIMIFNEKFDHPACHVASIKAFSLVLKFYSQLKTHPSEHDFSHISKSQTRTISRIKQMVFSMILSLRSNSLGYLGLVIENANQQNFTPPSHLHLQRAPSNEENIKFSPYILLYPESRQTSPSTSPRQSSQTISQQHQPVQKQPSLASSISDANFFQTCLNEALHYVIEAIRNETDWSVLELIFDKLAKMLKNKGLILSLGAFSSVPLSQIYSPHELSFPDYLVIILDKFVENLQTKLSEFDFSESGKMLKVDILSYVYKSISELVCYNLTPSNQSIVINCLKNGLVQFSQKTIYIRQCIISLTLCSMEMQTQMSKTLRDIILQLTKITTTKALAVPKLEFLSNIILFPDLYYSFTAKQFCSVFSIAMQYVNPYKYGEYTVVLALRVISMWILRCPSNYRYNLLKYITNGLNTNILKETEPTTPQLSQRLSSLSSLSSEHRSKLENRLSLTSSPPPPPTTPVNVSSQFSFSFHSSPSTIDSHHPLSSSASSAFNVCSPQLSTEGLILDPNDKENSKIELVECCLDMFSTNAFNTSSPLPLKPSMVDKLLNRDKSQIWILGHKIIQITTTGCSSRAIRNGLCNKCYYICHLNEKDSNSSTGDSNSGSSRGSQTNVFTDRLSTQMSYEQASVPSKSLSRRRHQSEIAPTAMSSSRISKGVQLTNDDYFTKRNQPQVSVASSDPDLNNNNNNVDTRYCRCWCQNWAEILIRRSTGNTRWIMRIENNLGDFPYWSFSKEEDDSLAKIFSHADPDINIALKLQKAAEMEPDESVDREIALINQNKTENGPLYPAEGDSSYSVQTFAAEAPAHRSSMPVTRTASFGNRRPIMKSNFIEQQNSVHFKETPTSPVEHPQMQSIRRLEKNYSVDEDEPPSIQLTNPSTFAPTVSPVASVISGDSVNSQTTFRDRSSTISVMTPVQKSASSTGVSNSQTLYDNSKSTSTLNLSDTRPTISSSALHPQSVFLQLFYNSAFKDVNEISLYDKPILLDKSDALVRSLSTLDRVTPYETHKIGLLYVGPGQVSCKTEILANQMGSMRYTLFMKQLGHFINLEDVDANVCYTGGLDAKKDGKYSISWGDHLVQAIFHVATLMPNDSKDVNCHNKMAHIGNDFICIVYNNSGEKFDIATIKGDGQFLQAMVVITPLEHESNSVLVQAKREFSEFIGHTEAQIISDNSLAVYVRQLALNANLAAMVINQNKNYKSYNISNWINRLQTIKRIRKRASDKLPNNPINPELVHHVRSMPMHPLQQSHSRARLGTGPSQSSKDESDSVISSSVASPSIPGSAGLSTGSMGPFDYEAGSVRLAFPDFSDFTKDLV